MEIAKSAVNWGSVPDWVAAIGSVLAFGGFAVGLWWEIRRRRLDRHDIDAQQARLVFAELAGNTASDCFVRVTNNSDHPMYDVEITLFDSLSTNRQRIPGGLFAKDVPARSNVDRVVEDDMVAALKRVPRFDPADRAPELVTAFVEIQFVDSGGRYWRRFERDAPVRLQS